MRKLLSILLLALVCTATQGAVPAWEEVSSPRQEVVQQMDLEQPTQIATVDGYIYLWTARPVAVKVYSILGQLIVQKELPSGLHRLRIPARGVYILRAGATTRRITL